MRGGGRQAREGQGAGRWRRPDPAPRTWGERRAQGELELEPVEWMKGNPQGETRGFAILLTARLGPSVLRVPRDWFLGFGLLFWPAGIGV